MECPTAICLEPLMTMSHNLPPGFPLKLLKWFCRPKYHSDIEGDLLELFDRRAESYGLRTAKWLLLKDVLLLFRPGIIRTFNIKFRFMLKENLKIAGRQMFKNKVFTAINLAGLTVGMATALLILIWAQNEWSFDRFYPNANNLYRIICHWEGEGEHLTLPTIPIRLRDLAGKEIPEIEDFFIMYPGNDNPLVKTSNNQTFEEGDLAYISDNWLDEFSYQVVLGSKEAFRANKFGVALTEERARKFFGDSNPLGKTLEIYANNYTVELVLKDNPANSSFQQKVFLPLRSYWPYRITYEEELRSSNYKFVAFFRAPEEIDQKKIEAQLSVLMSQVDQNKPTSASIFALTDMRFQRSINHDVFKHQNRSSVNIFALIGLIILAVALLNYVNLSTATINKRIQEIGIRKVVGASFRNIFSQILTEVTIVSTLSFLLALAAVFFFLPFLADHMDLALRLDLRNGHIWLLFGCLLGLSIIVAALYPALLHAEVGPIQIMRSGDSAGKGALIRKVLVIGQFTAAIVVLISTAVVYQQLRFIQSKDVGYDREQVMSLRLKFTAGDNYRENADRFVLLKNELELMTEIKSIAITDRSIADISNRNSGSLSWEGKPADESIIVVQLKADEDLNAVFDFEMIGGRWFSSDNTSDRNNIIINESAVREFNIPEPVVGRASRFQGREGQIIGVVKDFIFADLHQEIEPLVIYHNRGIGQFLLAQIQGDNISNTITQVESKFKQFFPDKPFEYTFLDDTFQQMHQADIKMGLLLRIFTGIIIFVSCLGLLGLTIFDAQRRGKEIAIRKVLGAGIPNILGLLSKQYIILVGLAFLIAAPVTIYFVQNWLENFAYHINLSWWIFVIPGFVAILISLVVMSFHSFKAALVNPVDELRH